MASKVNVAIFGSYPNSADHFNACHSQFPSQLFPLSYFPDQISHRSRSFPSILPTFWVILSAGQIIIIAHRACPMPLSHPIRLNPPSSPLVWMVVINLELLFGTHLFSTFNIHPSSPLPPLSSFSSAKSSFCRSMVVLAVCLSPNKSIQICCFWSSTFKPSRKYPHKSAANNSPSTPHAFFHPPLIRARIDSLLCVC